MEILELFLVLVMAVLVSALLDKVLPHIAAPLVQVTIGLVMALALSVSPVIEADTELFMMLFIAPLLFYESKELDKTALWKDKGTVLCLSIGLVLVMMVLVGLALHLVFPDIPVALCFAVGAALGPTDAAAVVALARSTKFPKRIDGVLAAEAIYNDATGVVAFEFALAAAISGTFDPAQAAGSFLVVFFGGLLCGTVLGALGNWATTIVRNRGMVSMTFHVLFELAMPFLSFVVGEAIGVSGILSAVACGLVFDLRGNGTGADVSRSKIVSNGIWKVVSFTLNGIVFVLLGLQLPNGVKAMLSHSMDTGVGFFAVAIVLAIVVAFRFVWCLAVAKFSRRGWGDNGEDLGLARIRLHEHIGDVDGIVSAGFPVSGGRRSGITETAAVAHVRVAIVIAAGLGVDQHDAERCVGTVDGCGGSILQHGNALDIVGIHPVEGSDNTVYEDEGRAGVDGIPSADVQRNALSGTACCGGNRHSGDRSLEYASQIGVRTVFDGLG